MLEEFSIVFGIIVSYWITFGTRHLASEWAYRLPFLLQILPALFLGSAIFLLPFSPRWLAQKGRDDECLHSLSRLRAVPADDPRVQAEWLDIRAEAAFHREVQERRHPGLAERAAKGGGSFLAAVELELSAFADCFKNGYLKRTLVGIMLMFFQQFVGINALIYYSPSLFETMGIGYEMRLVLGGILNCIQLVGVSTSLYTMDAWGRRSLLVWGALGMGICHIIIAALVGLYFDSWAEHVDMGWVSVAFLFLYMLIFGASWGPVPWGKFFSGAAVLFSHPSQANKAFPPALPSEIFPSSIRANGVAWSTCSNWFNNFIIGLITPPLIQNTRGFGAYTFFAVFCILGMLWAWFCVPETAGKSLEEMDQVFNDATGTGDQIRQQQILGELRARTRRSPQHDDA